MKSYSYFRLTRTLGASSVPAQNIGLVSPTHGQAFTLSQQDPASWFWTGVYLYSMSITRPGNPAGSQSLSFDRVQIGLTNLNPNMVVKQNTQVNSFRILLSGDANLAENGFSIQLQSVSMNIEALVWYFAGFADGDMLSMDGYCEFDFISPRQRGGKIVPPEQVRVKGGK